MRVTAILAFLASTVIPFIQEVADFIESLKKGSYSSKTSQALSTLSDECISTVMANSGREKTIDDYVKQASVSKERPKQNAWSRFIGRD